MTDPTLIADLVRAGVDADLVGRVSNALVTLRERDASRSVTIPTRSKAAERAARYREKLKRDKANAEANDAAQADSQGVTPERDASRHGVTDAPTFLSSFSLNEEEPSEKGSKKKKQEGTEIARARGQRMLAGAILIDEYHEAARQLGAAPQDIPEMWVEFVDYWVAIPGQRGCKTDWPATWRNRVRAVLKRGNGNGRAKPQSLSERAHILAEQARSAERAAGIDRSDDPFRKH